MGDKLMSQIPPLAVRLQPAIHSELKDLAKANGRSLNSEIAARLESTIYLAQPTEAQTLRDSIAMAALQPVVARFVGALAGQDLDDAASEAYAIADAMIAARSKGRA